VIDGLEVKAGKTKAQRAWHPYPSVQTTDQSQEGRVNVLGQAPDRGRAGSTPETSMLEARLGCGTSMLEARLGYDTGMPRHLDRRFA